MICMMMVFEVIISYSILSTLSLISYKLYYKSYMIRTELEKKSYDMYDMPVIICYI